MKFKELHILSLALIAALVLSSCSSVSGLTPMNTPETKAEETAYEAYMNAYNLLNEAGSYEADMLIGINMSIGEESFEVSMGGSVAVVMKSETDLELYMDMFTDMMGFSIDMEIFYKDGITYTSVMGEKVKQVMTNEQILAQANAQAPEFAEDAIREQSIRDVEGGREAAFTLDGSALTDMLDTQLSGMGDLLGGEGIDYSYGEVIVTAFIADDGTLGWINMSFGFDMSLMGETISSECAVHMEFTQIGGVTIEFPDDLDTYILTE